MFDFRRITLFCLEKRLSKHKMTVFSKKLREAMAPLAPLATPMGDSSFNDLENMLFLVSSLAQAAKVQMTVLGRFVVHVCITFWVELNVNEVYMSQAIFFVAVAA